jgi:plasmid stabilization system protein ParE
MTKLLLSPEAQCDLETIKAYISNELANPIAARNVVSRITKSLKSLKDMPDIGPKLSSKISVETGYRFLVSGKYLAFYRHENTTVFVDRILYGGRDYVSILFPELAKSNAED